MSISKPYKNVFEALEDDPAVADNLRLRAEMMNELRNHIEQEGITQEEAARLMSMTQPRISDLVRGKIDRFTIDMLVNMLARVGIHVELVLKQAAWSIKLTEIKFRIQHRVKLIAIHPCWRLGP